tara:strand:+ start:575 stop:1441 length:867 start_codon:yes stop_codon:yes gene_type:complete
MKPSYFYFKKQLRHNKSIYLIYFIYVVFFLNTNKSIGQNKYIYAFALNGLNLRSGPDVKSKILATLKFGTLLELKSKTNIFYSLLDNNETTTGEWVEVEKKGNRGLVSGYVLDAFLTNDKKRIINYENFKAPNKLVGYNLIARDTSPPTIFKLTKKLKVIASSVMIQKITTIHSNGYQDINEIETISFKNCTEEDAIILFASLYDFYLKTDSLEWGNSKKKNAREEYISFKNKDSHYWDDLIGVTRNIKTKEIIYLSRETRGEGGGGGASIFKTSKNEWTYTYKGFAD